MNRKNTASAITKKSISYNKYSGYRTFAHSWAVALRGKFCSDKSLQNLKPLKSYIRCLSLTLLGFQYETFIYRQNGSVVIEAHELPELLYLCL